MCVAADYSQASSLMRREFSAARVAERLLDVGVLTKDTHRNTIRMAPPFLITPEQIDWAVDRLEEVLDDVLANAAEPLAAP